MLNPATAKLIPYRITSWCSANVGQEHDPDGSETTPSQPRTEAGFEIAQSMGIALLGLVVAAAFATALESLGVDVIDRIRSELGL